MTKRYSGDWMVLADDRILEYLSEEEAASPSEMVKSGFVRYSNGYISQRCSKMVDHGLLNRYGSGVYAITERGEKYLKGELDTSVDSQDRIKSSNDNGSNSGDNHEEA